MEVAVLVDDREPAAVARAVRAHPDVETVEVERLPVGDLIVGETGFERKTVRDYVTSVTGRAQPDLGAQVERLAASYPNAYVLLEGDLPTTDAIEGDVSAAAVRGSMASITARHGVPVIPCGDLSGLVDMAVRIGRKHAEDPSPRRLSRGAVTDVRAPTTMRMYGCIDGIGPRMAARLHEAFPSVESLLSASREELLAVEGIGPKRAKAIEAAFRSGAEPKTDEA